MSRISDIKRKIKTNEAFRTEFFRDPAGVLEREFGNDLRMSDAFKEEIRREVSAQKRKLSPAKPTAAIGARGRRGKKTKDKVSIVM